MPTPAVLPPEVTPAVLKLPIQDSRLGLADAASGPHPHRERGSNMTKTEPGAWPGRWGCPPHSPSPTLTHSPVPNPMQRDRLPPLSPPLAAVTQPSSVCTRLSPLTRRRRERGWKSVLCGPELPYGEVVQTFQTGAEASREESCQSICPGGLMRDPSPPPPGPP